MTESPLTPDDWRQTEEIFHEVLDAPPGARDRLLRDRCRGDHALLEKMCSLVAAFEEEQRASDAARDLEPREQSEPASLAGRRIDAYEIDALIGHGGMGTVYLGHRADGQFDQKVAIKLIRLTLGNDYFRERFRRERQILASLDHPNITRLLDGAITPDGDPYLVMEFLDGEPIDIYCDRRDLPVPVRLKLFIDVCSAVAYAHRNLVVHGDLKPGNMFVTAAGIPKLLDFGTAKLLTGAGDTTTRIGMMTPRYASPEQLRGEPISTASDVYSLGMVLHELVTGAWPFGDPDSAVAGLERALGERLPARPDSLVTESAAKARSTSRLALERSLRGDLGNIVLKSLAERPSDRYRTVEEFAGDLDRYLCGRPVIARPQTFVYRTCKFVRRNWMPVAGAALCAIALAASAVYSAMEARTARREADKAKAVLRFFQGTLLSAAPSTGGRKELTVLDAMDQARANLWQLAGQPAVESALHFTIGTVYTGLSAYPKAIEELDRALVLARRSGTAEDIAWIQLAMGDLHMETLKDLAIAEKDYRDVLVYVRKTGASADPDLAHSVLGHLAGAMWSAHGHSPEVESLYRQSLQLARGNPRLQGFTVADDLIALGAYLAEESRNQEAEKVLQEALSIQRGMPHPTIAAGEALQALAQIRSHSGDLAGAEQYFRQYRDEMRKQLGPNHDLTIDATGRWGRLWATLGHPQEAAAEVSKAVATAKTIYPPGAQRSWTILVSYAYILNLAGRSKEAESYARESLEAVTDTSRTDPRRAESMAELGIALVAEKRYSEAVLLLSQSAAIYTSLPGWGPKHRQTLRVQEYLGKARAGESQNPHH